MKILLIRHGDPDYTIDSLTEKGWREAKLLSNRLEKLEIRDFYVSPLGRARATALFLRQLRGVCAFKRRQQFLRGRFPDALSL